MTLLGLTYNNYMQQKSKFMHNPSFNAEDWTLVDKPNMKVLVNKHTIDQFVLDNVKLNTSHLIDIYKARAQYTIPHTPQIILGKYHSDSPTLETFVQYAPFNLERIIKKNSCEALLQILIRNIFQSVEYLVRKYGFFRITKQMIRVTRSSHFLVWVHENFISTHRQYPLSSGNIYEDYRTMIQDFIEIFQNAGCKNSLKNIRQKIFSDKLLSFQKFKNILENQLQCKTKSKQKSERPYRSPQFLKGRCSPNSSNRAITQNFVSPVEKKHYRQTNSFFTGGDNLNTSNSFYRMRDQCETFDFDPEKAKINPMSNSSSKKSIYISSNIPKSSCFKIHSSKQSMDLGKIHINQNLSENIEIKKKIRDSGNSLATTGFVNSNSICSSGRMKNSNFDDHNFSSLTSSEGNNKALASSLGEKKKIKDLKQTFKVKISKIIEQKNQDMNTNTYQSFIKGQNSGQFLNMQKSQFEKDFDELLKSQRSSDCRQQSSGMNELQSQIFNILLR